MKYMWKQFAFVSFLFFLLSDLTAQTLKIEDNQIIVGKVDSVYSQSLGEERSIWVHVPRSAQESDKRFPVVYVLDGSAHFYSIVGMLRQLSVSNGNTLAPEIIVVGIPNTNRTRDLTPSEVSYFPGSGGAEQFTTFLEEELMPYIDQNYPTTSYRTLIGHSWGALFVLNTLVDHPALFDNYVSIDPGMRWDKMSFMNKVTGVLESTHFDRKSLYLSVANRLPKGLNLETVKSDSSKFSEHMRVVLRLVEVCKRVAGLNFGWKFYPEDNHNGVPMIAGYDAVRFLFNWYGFNEEIIFQEGPNMTTEEFMNMLKLHYRNIADHFGHDFLAPERLINRLGDIAMSVNEQDKALALFQMNIDNYPESAAVYDAMGDYHRSQKDFQQAIAFYERSLGLEETPSTRRKLSRLKESGK